MIMISKKYYRNRLALPCLECIHKWLAYSLYWVCVCLGHTWTRCLEVYAYLLRLEDLQQTFVVSCCDHLGSYQVSYSEVYSNMDYNKRFNKLNKMRGIK